MDIYFGRVPDAYLEEGEVYFEENGNKYYFKLSLDTGNEEFTIYDTANRYIPFSSEAAHDLKIIMRGVAAMFLALEDLRDQIKFEIND